MLRRAFVLAAAVAIVACVNPVVAEEARAGTHEGKVVKAEAGKLTMTDKDGKEHSHKVGADVKVTCDGKECKLEELKAGSTVKVTVEKKDDKSQITKIEAKKAE